LKRAPGADKLWKGNVAGTRAAFAKRLKQKETPIIRFAVFAPPLPPCWWTGAAAARPAWASIARREAALIRPDFPDGRRPEAIPSPGFPEISF
jgi:hypothetical protein